VVSGVLVSNRGISDEHARNGVQPLDMRRTTEPGAEYKLKEEVLGSFLGTNPSGHPALVIPTSAERAPLDHATGSIALSFRPTVRFELRRTKFDAPAAILTCMNDALAPTFGVLARDLAIKTDAKRVRPAPSKVSRLFSSWEELLRRRRALSREEETGLWGELWLLLNAPSLDRAVTVWRGPSGDVIDFVGGGVGVECKTTMRRLEHHFSQTQLERALGDIPIYIVSLWVDRDEVGGRTLNEMVDAAITAAGDSAALEKGLLEAGYSREDTLLYSLKLRVLEAPLWFEQASIPRVRAADPGVSSIRFLATLDESRALPPERGIALLAQLCGEALS
jgi:hypothetical protein